ncbi:type II toxin-antitoxin system RelE/ParE family toxin [Rhizobium sp.]
MRYRLTNHSEVPYDFAAILDLIGNYAGYRIARKKIDEIRKTIFGLKQYPHIGTAQPDIMPNLRMIPSIEKAVICFTVDDEARVVYVLSVTYAGQDWQRIAKSRED